MGRTLVLFLLWAAATAAAVILLATRVTGLPPFGELLDPVDGLYRTARMADGDPPSSISLPGLEARVEVRWDDRRVPHIFAETDLDAVAAMGYVVARDRLFQMDFIPRAASGRLAEALGPAAVSADRFLRRTGMDRAARQNLERIRDADGDEWAVMTAYCRGVNAYIDQLSPSDLPFEFRLLGYEPDPCTPIQALRVLQYMNYDLSYGSDDPRFSTLRQRLGAQTFAQLYPSVPRHSVPIVPSVSNTAGRAPVDQRPMSSADPLPISSAVSGRFDERSFPSNLVEGFMHGKGSNNWAVDALRSTSGAPLLAGDMHLSVTLPAIWYEVHLVTPKTNVYGVTVPGAPVPVEAYNDHLAWAFTNTGADQIDHYRMDVDPSTHTYRFAGEQRALDVVFDTIRVNGGAPVIDTLFFSHWGPVTNTNGEWTAIQWTAHHPSQTLGALWEMNHARDHDSFQQALRKWDTPMQNILYADRTGTVSIRSSGYLPLRAGGDGVGLLDGSSPEAAWTGRVPFDDLPYAVNPARGFLTSTNQRPVDGTYPYFLGVDWGRAYRSIRIDSLLRSRTVHSVDDLKRYQADVHAVQRDFFVPLLDTLQGLSPVAAALRDRLTAWDGDMALDEEAPIALHYLLETLRELTWDEDAFFDVRVGPDGDTLDGEIRLPRPDELRMYDLLDDNPDAAWLDVQATPERETARDLLRMALDTAARELSERYGPAGDDWLWGERHKIRFDHLVGALEPLGRGPFSYPGYDETLSPASDTLATHSASWRVVVDLSGDRPRGEGVYPGGQSGNPFSRFYDLHLQTYLNFDYYELLKPSSPSDLDGEQVLHRAVLRPVTP